MAARRSSAVLDDKDPIGNTKVRTIGEKCLDAGTRFVDKEFPANNDSIFRNPKKRGEWLKNAEITWCRPDEIGDPNAEWHVFKDIEPEDIKQGNLGDCYFLAALASVATQPELIDNIIVEEYAKQGVYGVKFFQMGHWQTVIVDDLFPCVRDDGAQQWVPVFAGYCGKEKEIWMMICEKAWAKLNGSYQVLTNGMVPDMLVYLTGGFREIYHLESEEDWNQYVSGNLWNNLYTKMKDQSRQMLFMACGGFQDEDELQIGGLVENDQDDDPGLMGDHAYSVLDMVEVPKAGTRTGKLQLIQVRNPWGSYEWTGDYGDDSPLWTDDLKQACDYVKKDDGAFWMNFEDFCDYFTFIGACITNPEWEIKSIKTRFEIELTAGGRQEEMFKHNPTLLLKNTSRNVVIQVEQDDIRDNEPHNMFYFDVFLNVIAKKDDRIPNLGDTVTGAIKTETGTKAFRLHSCQRITSIWLDLPVGEYYLVVTRQHAGFSGNCAVNVFSDTDFDLEELKPIPPNRDAKAKMKKAKIQRDPTKPRCSITHQEIDLSSASNYVVKKGVFWDISKKKRNFRCAECLRSFDKEAPFYDIGKEDGEEWAGYCQRCFKTLFFPRCVVCDKTIFNTEECSICNGEFIRVGGDRRVHEQCWVEYMLNTAKSNLTCPLLTKNAHLPPGKGAVIVRIDEDQQKLDKLKQFVDANC